MLDMNRQIGMSLLELIVVLAVMAGLAGIITPLYTGVLHDARSTSTRQTVNTLANATSKYWADTKHVVLDGVSTAADESERFQVKWLFRNPVSGDNTRDFDPNTRIGWRGPYLLTSTGDPLADGNPFMIDAWNRRIEMQDVDSTAEQRDVRIVSGGPNETIDIPAGTATDDLTELDVGDDIYVSLRLQ